MGTKEKLLDRFLSMPRDFTYDEVVRLFRIFGFEESNKGATSGSRVKFSREGFVPFYMHKPHPSKVVKAGTLQSVFDYVMAFQLMEEYYERKETGDAAV